MPEAPEITAMKKNCNDRDYVLKTVNENGKLLEFAAEEFHNDREIVLDAVRNNPEALEFASPNLKKIEKLFTILLVSLVGLIVMLMRF